MIIDPFLNNPKTHYYQLLEEDSLQNNMNQWTNMPAISDELYNELLREFEQDSCSYSSPILST